MTTAPSVAIATVAALLVYSFARAIRSPLRRWRRRATLQPRLDSVMVGRGLLLFGFVCLAVVVLTHVAEWLRVFPGACEVALVITSILSVPYLAVGF
jgi:uncharacterized membrane protein YdcZ (DUF606 family)